MVRSNRTPTAIEPMIVARSLNRGFQPSPRSIFALEATRRAGPPGDLFGINPHNFGFSETTDFVNFRNIGHFSEVVIKATNFSSPKHGAIIPVTIDEAQALASRWRFDF